jgi:hypothetical protein
LSASKPISFQWLPAVRPTSSSVSVKPVPPEKSITLSCVPSETSAWRWVLPTTLTNAGWSPVRTVKLVFKAPFHRPTVRAYSQPRGASVAGSRTTASGSAPALSGLRTSPKEASWRTSARPSSALPQMPSAPAVVTTKRESCGEAWSLAASSRTKLHADVLPAEIRCDAGDWPLASMGIRNTSPPWM